MTREIGPLRTVAEVVSNERDGATGFRLALRVRAGPAPSPASS